MYNANKVDIVIDIETIALPLTQEDIDNAIAEYPGAPSHYKTDEAKANHYKKYVESLTSGDNPDKFKVHGKRMISIALGRISDMGGVVDIECFYGDDTRILAEGFCRYVDDLDSPYRLVGYNTMFDTNELCKILKLNKVRPKRRIKRGDIIDLSFWPLKQEGDLRKLKKIAPAFGIKPSGTTGNQVAEMYAEGDWEGIAKYNKDDVRVTGELLLSLEFLYDFNGW